MKVIIVHASAKVSARIVVEDDFLEDEVEIEKYVWANDPDWEIGDICDVEHFDVVGRE